MKNEPFVFSRTMFCPECARLGRPRKGDFFGVWRHDHNDLIIKQAHQDGIRGFTPFFCSYDNPYEVVNGKIKITISCGIHGCGISFNKEEGQAYMNFLKSEHIWLPVNEVKVLQEKWKNTGYELI